MGSVVDSMNMFNRFNTNYAVDGKGNEVLDANEVAKAKQAGFDLFELKDNMTRDEFVALYDDCAAKAEASDEAVFEQKQRGVHVKFLQIQYDTDEPINDGEDLNDYEARLKSSVNNQSADGGTQLNAKKDMGI